jgi:hypothetical protein
MGSLANEHATGFKSAAATPQGVRAIFVKECGRAVGFARASGSGAR